MTTKVANLTADAVVKPAPSKTVFIANFTVDVIVRSPAITITDVYRPHFTAGS